MIDNLYVFIPLALIFLSWGSFLNVVGYRIIKGINILFPRSHCPHCKAPIKWYDLIPILSYCLLKGKCRICSSSIPFLYPFIELFSMVTFLSLTFYIPYPYNFGYFIFFSSLIVCMRSDFETMLLSRWVTLYFAPVGWLCAYWQIIPISITESIFGSVIGFGLLWAIARIFTFLTKKEGLGQGDVDLMACVGAFTGLIGIWDTLMIGSTLGVLSSVLYCYLAKKDFNTPLPFGPFLALGAIAHILMTNLGYSLILLF